MGTRLNQEKHFVQKYPLETFWARGATMGVCDKQPLPCKDYND